MFVNNKCCNRLIKSGLFCTILTCFSVVSANAADIRSSIEPAQLKKRFEKFSDTPEIDINKSPAGLNDDQPVVTEIGQKGILFTAIVFRGLSIYQPVDLLPVYEKHLGSTIDITILKTIANAITQKYREQGYSVARATVPEQKITGGIVRMDITEGAFSRIRFKGDIRGKEAYLRSYLDGVPLNEPLNGQTLERAILLLNDIPGLIVIPRIQAIEDRPNQFELIIEVQQKFLTGEITVDNRGSKLVGEEQGLISFDGYSALKQYEHIQLKVASTAQSSELDYYALNTSWPVGRHGTALKFDSSYLESKPGDILESLNVDISSVNATIGIYQPVVRSKNKSILLEGKINYYKSKTAVQNEAAALDRLYTLRMQLNFVDVKFNYHFNRFRIGINQSLHGLNDTLEITTANLRSTGKEKFSVLQLEYLREKTLNEKWLLSYGLTGQYADSGLPASERFAFGGEVIGRAYDPAEITGDHGLAANAYLQYQLEKSFIPQSVAWLYVFYDIGRVWDIESNIDLSAASSGFGINVSSKHFTGSLEIAKPLTRSIFLEGGNGDKPRLFAKLNYRF